MELPYAAIKSAAPRELILLGWLTLLIASTGLFTGAALKAWDRAQERVYGSNLTVGHVLKRRPGHDLELSTVERRNSGRVEPRKPKQAVGGYRRIGC